MKTWHCYPDKKQTVQTMCCMGALVLAGMLTAPLAWAQRQQVTQQVVVTPQAQQTVQQAVQATQATAASTRFIEACRSAASKGQIMPGCNNVTLQLSASALEQLQQEALRTRNPQLMTMVGDSYQNRQRAGFGDVSQAYRWYVLGAVRGDPQAMARLSEMYRRGQGTAPDRVKAMGYAKLAQQIAPDSAAGKQAEQTARALSKSMASKELAQADRFAAELAQQMGGVATGMTGPGATEGMPAVQLLGGQRLPGEAGAAVEPPQASQTPRAQASSGKGSRQKQEASAAASPVSPALQAPMAATVLPGQLAGQVSMLQTAGAEQQQEASGAAQTPTARTHAGRQRVGSAGMQSSMPSIASQPAVYAPIELRAPKDAASIAAPANRAASGPLPGPTDAGATPTPAR